ncbi:hypothetical protein CBR_g11091 [Chara braunii]|uniref:Myb-like domain-containing protein n=1 Tax=Chara braunii TaxID=69332 RepID=A0A388KQ81_CHABU|nr:hypothetical protein CBR_g11091 [Chara braunii]|eukprot:GBG72158.1 hypothetical protein CBR_g11091 [Chara braunii]
MADLYRRLPLLLLVALLLLIVVVFHICFLGRVPGRKQTRRTAKRATKMDKFQTKTTLSVGGGGSSRQRCKSAEGGRRSYDPTLYSHLPSHEIPLPPGDEDVDNPKSSTVPLGSGSMQDWMGNQVYRHASTPTYTDLLEGRTPAGYDTGLVDLSFGLRSGSGEGLTHTVLVNPASASKHTSPSVRAAGPADSRGFVSPRRVALSTASVAASKKKTVGLAGCRMTTPGGAIDGEGDDDERNATEVVGRQFWDDERQRLRSTNTASITRGVARISVGAEEEFQDCAGGGGEEIAADAGGDDNDEDDDNEMEIRPVGRKRGGSTARTKVRESRTGRKHKKNDEELSAGDGTKSRDFWTVEHMIALIRAKRDQDSHLAGLGHNHGRMKTKTWKWEDVEKRLVQMGVTGRKAVDCRKKWDNLYQQFKSVHKFMGESGKPNFFTLTPGERRERGFDFRMDERVYSEMKAMSRGDHTIHPTNLADTGRAVVDGLSCPWCTARPRTVEKGIPGGIPYRWHSIATATKAPFVHGIVVAGVVIRLLRYDRRVWAPRASTSSCIHVSQVACHRTGPSSTAAKRLIVNVVRRQGARHRPPAAPSSSSSTWSFVHVSQAPQLSAFGTHFFVDDMAPRGASGKVKRNSGSGDGGETQKSRGHIPKSKRPRFDDYNSEHSGDLHGKDESMVDAQGADVMKRLGFGRDGVSREQLAAVKQGLLGGVAVSLARTPRSAGIVMTDARAARQVPPKVVHVAPRQPIPAQQAGTSGVEKTLSAQKVDTTTGGGRTAVAENTTVSGARRVRERGGLMTFAAMMGGRMPGGGAMMTTTIDDPAQREPALRRARNVEKVVLRAIHDWIFKSSSRSTGFARAESYVTLDFATDVARAVWQALEWSRVVSPALVYHTLAMKMDVPLWFAGVKIVDRPEDDDMAARQEATILRLVDCWTDAVWCRQWVDGGRLKQDRLTRLADCLRVLLSACIWIMRMGGDDDRSHYEASFYASMVAKPTLIAAGSYIFNWRRRHIVDSANLVLDRLGKAHLTQGDYPHCIPEWADCGLVFGHNAALKNAAEAAKHGWIGSGPPADDDGDDEK